MERQQEEARLAAEREAERQAELQEAEEERQAEIDAQKESEALEAQMASEEAEKELEERLEREGAKSSEVQVFYGTITTTWTYTFYVLPEKESTEETSLRMWWRTGCRCKRSPRNQEAS